MAEFQFSNSSHNISEESGTVTICLELIGGILAEDVFIEVNLTVDNTAATC